MKRRKFIVLFFIGVLTTLGGSILVIPFESVVRRILNAELRELKLSDELIEKFVEETRGVDHWKQFSFSKKLIIRLHTFIPLSSIFIPYHHKFIHYKNIIIGDFLFATNYFSLAKDTSREIEYTGLLNPYRRICYNPFAGHA
jgi:hypothetical protein